MTPLEKCMQALRPLIGKGDVNAIPLAEMAIKEFLAAHDGPNRQTGALTIFKNVLTADFVSWAAPQDFQPF